MLDSSLTKAVYVKNYEIQISKSKFTHIQVYFCRVSFLTTLDIYKDYFKRRQSDARWLFMHIMTRDNLPYFIIFFIEVTTFLRQGFCNQGASWSSSLDELNNFADNIFLKLVC